MPVKTVKEFGASRQKIRVYTEGDLIRVRWRENGQRLTRSWPATRGNMAIAKAFAKGIEEGRNTQVTVDPPTLRELWEKFVEAEFHHLRPKTKKLYAEYWEPWEIMWGEKFVAERTTLIMASEFRAARTRQNRALSTTRHEIETVKMVYRWGKKHKLLPSNELAEYEFKIAKESRKAPPAEYSSEEADAILAQLNPNSATEWRAWVALTICRQQGVRQNSVLHLKWADVTTTDITWRAEWDKNGKEWSQPLREGTRKAIAIAALWTPQWYHCKWVLPSGYSRKNMKDPYTIGGLYLALRKAEDRAGVKHLANRGGHGFRRLLAGDISAATGDAALAMLSIGDDVRQAPKYIQKRDGRVAEAFALLDKPRTASEAATGKSIYPTTKTPQRAVKPVKPNGAYRDRTCDLLTSEAQETPGESQ